MKPDVGFHLIHLSSLIAFLSANPPVLSILIFYVADNSLFCFLIVFNPFSIK